jgi:hypothetical protein
VVKLEKSDSSGADTTIQQRLVEFFFFLCKDSRGQFLKKS